ncbi:hypothetical protein [Paenibacillus glucanolyticus]|uniref:hypothetical protein n=1 Tax=Paenibacillus glucanolyticus TaxID=59843 RepID=UPI00096D7ECB|nr:hypothetical protein [Paenibacillus glucanolyticus]OMF81583.1 hypothetical protein BK142_03655 [Paenibacillus glucanolyticus]
MNLEMRIFQRLVESDAIQVRREPQDKAYWYTSSQPGPFYVNTQYLAGKEASNMCLSKINQILSINTSLEDRAIQIKQVIIDLFNSNNQYKESIYSLIEFLERSANNQENIISGGERRDWFFSIPIAVILNKPHMFLMKDGTHTTLDNENRIINNVEAVLHIADIINSASSYKKYWIPILEKNNYPISRTLVVALRNYDGKKHLLDNNIELLTPVEITEGIFDSAYKQGIINQFAYKEIINYLSSPEEWITVYLDSCKKYNLLSNIDEMENKRAYQFLSNPKIKNKYPDLLDVVEKNIGR